MGLGLGLVLGLGLGLGLAQAGSTLLGAAARLGAPPLEPWLGLGLG